MKKFLPVLMVITLALVGCGVFIGARYASEHFLSHTQKVSSTVQCTRQPTVHTVTIQNSQVFPVHTQAALCDTLTIINDDNILRLMAFGEHENHQAYDGITEKLLEQGQNLTVTLNQAGTFKFHDHLHDAIQGDFTVTR
jgi:hypothetical protein